MSLTVYYILFATIMLIGAAWTMWIGVSKKNREGNPGYDNKTKGNWSRLSWIYIAVLILGYAALIIYIVQ
ncbi:hypothetical protein ACFQI7_03710 [Paenibacillus allorhizosphaerae]|uniref:Uncharacterized protein n=1 Tax=Paenibacillus allorhizosphaerae TaxID=2849866 RepID=A0ABN7THC6_9BACL|nr:hypothetical protein [Paenibacillus allorhizosphaerae]CAG7624638.1 hypothetical protein PAECIP111802_01085 [Paenibacillus allorhizosphaerae]